MTAVLDELTVNPHDPTGLGAAVDCVLAGDPADWNDTALASEIIGLRGSIDRLEAHFARVTWAAHQRGIGAADGSASTAGWLRRHTGMRDGDARAMVEADAASDALPQTGAAWRDGTISARVRPARSSVPASTATTRSCGPSNRSSWKWHAMV